MRTRAVVAALVAALTLVPATGAFAASPGLQFDMRGYDPAVTSVPGGYVLDGAAWGTLLEGDATVAVVADDGSLPGPSECEPAHVDVDMGVTAEQRLRTASTGELCDHWGSKVYFGSFSDVETTGGFLPRARGTGFVSVGVQTWGTAIWTETGTLRGVARTPQDGDARPPQRPETRP